MWIDVMRKELGGDGERFRGEVAQLLNGVTVEAPAVRGILRVVGRFAEGERAGALQAGLGNEARQFNAGRAAAAEDLLETLLQVIPKGEEGDGGKG